MTVYLARAQSTTPQHSFQQVLHCLSCMCIYRPNVHMLVIAGVFVSVSSALTVVLSARWQRYQSLSMHCSVAHCSGQVLKGLTCCAHCSYFKVACLELRENLLWST